MSSRYVLDGKQAVLEPSLFKWAAWFEKADRAVAKTTLPGGVEVSTVFLGLDHRFVASSGPPILFETMIFGGPRDGEQQRYATWEEAEKGHAEVVASISE